MAVVFKFDKALMTAAVVGITGAAASPSYATTYTRPESAITLTGDHGHAFDTARQIAERNVGKEKAAIAEFVASKTAAYAGQEQVVQRRRAVSNVSDGARNAKLVAGGGRSEH